MIDVDRKGGGGRPEITGGMLMDFIMFGVFADLAIFRDPQVDFTYAIF